MGEEALGDRWARLLGCRLGLLQRGRIDTKRLDRIVLRRVDRGADLVQLIDHALSGCHHHGGHQGEQAEDDQAGGEGGLEPAALKGSDHRLEDHGQHGRERQREHDLADRAKRGDHDDRRHHKSHETPRPDPQPGNPTHERRGITRPRVSLGCRIAVSTSVGLAGRGRWSAGCDVDLRVGVQAVYHRRILSRRTAWRRRAEADDAAYSPSHPEHDGAASRRLRETAPARTVLGSLAAPPASHRQIRVLR